MHQQASFGLKFRRSTYQQILESGTFAFKLPKHRTQLCEDLNHISRVTETRFNIVTRRLISNYINRRDVGETGDIISDIFTVPFVCPSTVCPSTDKTCPACAFVQNVHDF